MTTQLLSIEYHKLRKLNPLKVMMLIYMALTPAWMFFLFYFFEKIIAQAFAVKRDPMAFPHIWNTATFTASYFNIMMGVIVILIVCNDYSFRTMKQNVIDGLTKAQVIWSKFLVILFLAAFVTVFTSLMALVVGTIYGHTDEMAGNIHFIPVYFLQALGYFSFAFFIAIMFRKTAISIVLFILFFIVEWIIGILITVTVSPKIYLYFPLNAMSKLTPNPIQLEFDKLGAMQKPPQPPDPQLAMSTNVIISLAVMAIFFGLSYWQLRRRDL